MDPKPHRVRAVDYILAFAVTASVCAMVLGRIDDQIIQGHGGNAPYIEHGVRLMTLAAWRTYGTSDPLEVLNMADSSGYPALLHLVTLVLGGLVGHRVQDVLWTGLLWLMLLAAGVGGCVGALSGSRKAALAGFAATMLLPAGHAVATRYYYDLPMSALIWVAAWIALATWDRRPLAGGALAGLLFALANMTKWTAMPFGMAFAGCAVLAPCRFRIYRPGRRVFAFAVALVVALAASGLYLKAAGEPTSLRLSMEEIYYNTEGISYPEDFRERNFVAKVLTVPDHGVPLERRLFFHPQGTFFAIHSPLLSFLLVALMLPWLVRSRRGWVLAVGVVISHWTFLTLKVPALHERFALTAAPAFTMVAVLGWATLGRRIRGAVAGVFIVAALLVGLDFHFDLGVPYMATPEDWTHEDSRKMNPPYGLGLAMNDVCWTHKRYQDKHDEALRERVWAKIRRCNLTSMCLPESAYPFISEPYDGGWLQYRCDYAFLEEGYPRCSIHPFCDNINPTAVAIAITMAGRGKKPDVPLKKPKEKGWRLERKLEIEGLGHDLAIWTHNSKKDLCR